jgi:hypothetical protein
LAKIGFTPMRQFPTARLPYPHAGDSKMARLCGFVEFFHRVDPVEDRDGDISENANSKFFDSVIHLTACMKLRVSALFVFFGPPCH